MLETTFAEVYKVPHKHNSSVNVFSSCFQLVFLKRKVKKFLSFQKGKMHNDGKAKSLHSNPKPKGIVPAKLWTYENNGDAIMKHLLLHCCKQQDREV